MDPGTEIPPEVDRAGYVAAVDDLLGGRPEEALQRLDAEGAEASAEVRLAAAKASIRLRRGADATRILQPLLASVTAETDRGMAAYLRLLAASAAALEDRPSDARALLEDIQRIDPRMEHAAFELRRRLDKGRPPAIRF